MKKSVKISQERSRITLRPDESVVVHCRDNNDNHRRRRLVVNLRPGDRVLVRCRHNNNNHGRR
jgi:translation initiation factor IF-1